MNSKIVCLPKIIIVITTFLYFLSLDISVNAQVKNGWENLKEPQIGLGVPTTRVWAKGMLMYMSATTSDENSGPFIVYDLKTNKVIYSGSADIHAGFRNIMVANNGAAYFSIGADQRGLAKYDPQTNTVTPLNITLSNRLRASAEETSDGFIYLITASNDIYKFNTRNNTAQKVNTVSSVTTHIVLDPSEKGFYYMPDAHGGAWEVGAPLMRYNFSSNTHTEIVKLQPLVQPENYNIGGTYALDVDKNGKYVYISANGEKLGGPDDRKFGNGFGGPSVITVKIPDSLRLYLPPDQPNFIDIASNQMLADPLKKSYIHSASWGDLNNDNRPDLFVGTFRKEDDGLNNSAIFINKGYYFEETNQNIIKPGRASGSVFADFDNDGDLDLVIINNNKANQSGYRGQRSQILRNDNGNFVDVTGNSGLDALNANGRQVGILDYNQDGLLDIFIVADALLGTAGNSVLLKNNTNFKFSNVTAQVGLPTNLHGLGLAISDVSNDGKPDIFIGGGGNHDKNRLYLSQSNNTYVLINNNDPIFNNSWPTPGPEDWVAGASFGDLDNDGDQDLVVGHHYGSTTLTEGVQIRIYLNKGIQNNVPLYEDITAITNLPKIKAKSPHVEIQDFNNDGLNDIYVSVIVNAKPLVFYGKGNVNNSPTFQSADVSNPEYYVAAPVADINLDGQLDIFMGNWRAETGDFTSSSKLFQNSGTDFNWLQIKVTHPSNTQGIGAKVTLYNAGQLNNSSAIVGYREISPSFGYSSSQEAIAHFGLKNQEAVDVKIVLPVQNQTWTYTNVPVNRRINLPTNSFIRAPYISNKQSTAKKISTNPEVYLSIFQLPNEEGNPWSTWGGATYASDGKFYASIGNHLNQGGHVFLYEYDPFTRFLTLVASSNQFSDYGHGKVHSRLDEAADGALYSTTYWGSRNTVDLNRPDYKGGILLKYQLSSTVATSTPQEPLLGDLNQDNRVNISDILSLVNIILSGETNASSDINRDGRTDTLDLVSLVSRIFSS